MAHFFGSVQGTRGEVSRLGHKATGLATTAASWHGAVHTYLYEQDGRDMCRVELALWHGHGVNRVLYDGPIDAPTPVTP